MSDTISCRSEEGITVGIIDSIITSLRLFKDRNLSAESIQEALLDIGDDPDFNEFLNAIEESKKDRTDEGIDRFLQLAGLK